MDGMEEQAGGLELRAPGSTAEWQAVHALRRRALFSGGGYDEKHPDDRDADHHVLVLVKDGAVLGTMRIDLSHPAWAAFRLVAVDPDHRGQGFGGTMLAKAEAMVSRRGWHQVRLHAKPEAVQFYRRNGYREVQWSEPPRDPQGLNMGKSLAAR